MPAILIDARPVVHAFPEAANPGFPEDGRFDGAHATLVGGIARPHRVRSTQASMPSASTKAAMLGMLTETSAGHVFNNPRCEKRPLRK